MSSSAGVATSVSRRVTGLALSGLIVLAFATTDFSQQTAGSIKGTITDQLGGLVVNATVAAIDAHGTQKTTTTNSHGDYEFRALAPGKYSIRVTATGFNTLEANNIEVHSGKNTTTDLQLIVGSVEQTVTIDRKGVSTDSDQNADARVLRERELEALPNEPEALAAALQAMAGPTQGENGPQVKVDGFSNGQIPPKEAIREVRINQNPYSAENEYPGWGGIEIYTQPGSDKYHGGASFGFLDEGLNSRNPFAPRRVPYQQRLYNANLTGPIKKKRASFAFYFNRNAGESNAIINATILDSATLKPAIFNQTVITPNVNTTFTSRGDLKLSKKHTLVASYQYNKGSRNPQGIGGFSLPSRAYRGRDSYQQFQMTETAVINEKTINETRLQVTRYIYRQIASSALPALNVQDSFFGGGAQVGVASNTQDRAELQNFTSLQSGKHFLKIGGRLRYVRIRSIAPSNFGGTYTFAGGFGPALDANDQVIPGGATLEISSLERYRRTLVFQRLGMGAAQIRNLGGGATQFSIAGGNPEAGVKQNDISFYIQDEWKVRPNLTISPGLRYENQENIKSDLNFAPRIGFAWSPTFGGKKKQTQPTDIKTNPQAKTSAPAKPSGPSGPKTVIRGGFGIFYNRIGEDLILQTLRYNGVNQRQFVVTDPAVLDLFPVVPAINLLDAFAQPQTRRRLSSDLAPNYSLRGSVSVEHQLSKNYKLSLTYSYGKTLRTLRNENINAPLAGTFNPAIPTSGTRPLGQGAGNVLEYESNGRSRYDNFSVNVSGKLKKVNFWSTYVCSKTRSTDNGTSGSSFDPYDFSREWGRANFDIRHWFYAGTDYQTKSGFSINSFIIGNSGPPFNITTGHDANGDTFFTERPAFATDLNKPGVVVTPIGAFDPNPSPGQQIIPRNFGQGPTFFSVNVGLSKVIKFGRAIPPKTPPPTGAGAVVNTTPPATATSSKPLEKPPIQRPYSLSFSIYITNALNHANKSTPVGNMSSPFFLQSTSTSGIFFFGPGGGGSGGNRQVSLRVRLSF
jgi:hypothetical protein